LDEKTLLRGYYNKIYQSSDLKATDLVKSNEILYVLKGLPFENICVSAYGRTFERYISNKIYQMADLKLTDLDELRCMSNKIYQMVAHYSVCLI
jgi:hypothetical protein